jgi:cell division septation protein DedD
MNQAMESFRHEILLVVGIDKPDSRKSTETIKKIDISSTDQKKEIKQLNNSVQETYPAKITEYSINSGNVAVQVFAVRNQEQALPYQEKLIKAEFPAYTIPAVAKGEACMRVRVGFFNSIDEATEVGKNIQRKGIIPEGAYWLARVSPKEKERARGY